MTDRVQVLTVVLDERYRTDDVENIVRAIEMVRGVAGVTLQTAGIDQIIFNRTSGLKAFEAMMEAGREHLLGIKP